MATYTVTNTQDTDAQLTPAPADVAGSFRAALNAASLSAGSTIAFSLAPNSTISLLSVTPPFTADVQAGSINFDFTGAPGLTVNSSTAGSVQGPFTVLRDFADMKITGTLAGDAASGVLLRLFSPTATATLNAGAGLVSTSASSTLDDGGATLTIGRDARVSATNGNALVIEQNFGAVTNQAVTVAAGAVISSTSTTRSSVFVATNALGATFSNAGTISSTGQAGYVGNSTAALTNAATGQITTSAGFAAVQLNGTSTLANAGAISSTGISGPGSNTGLDSYTAVFNNGTGAITNSGQITSRGGQSTVSLLGGSFTNSGTVANTVASSSGGAVVAQRATQVVNSGTISSVSGSGVYVGGTSSLTNAAGGVITSAQYGAVQTDGLATMTNAGTIRSTSTGVAAVQSTGSGAVTNSGVIQATAAAAYDSTLFNATSKLTNLAGGLVTTAAATSTVRLGGGASLVNAGSVTNTFAGANGTGVFIAGAGSLTNSGVISTASSNGYAVGVQAGATVTSTGVISASQAGAYAVAGFNTAGSGVITINLAAGSTTTGAVGGAVSGALAVTVAGSLNGAVIGGSAQADSLTLVNGLSFNSDVNLGGGGDSLVLTGAGGTSTLAASHVLSSVVLTKAGAGTWVLSGAGGAYASVALNGGVLELSAADAAGSGPITFGPGAQTLRLDTTAGQAFTLASPLTGFGVEDLIDVRNTTVTATAVSGDTLTLTTAGGASTVVSFAAGTLAGKTVVTAGDGAGGSYVSIGAAVAPAAVAPGQTTNLDSSNTAVVNGDVTDNGVAQVGGGAPVTYTGSISGTGSVAVSGGTVTFTGASTYTGATTVSAGTLVVNGSIASSPVSIGSGGVLGGSGTTGPVAAANGATVSPGNSPGVLTTNGDLTLAAGSMLKEEVGGLANTLGAATFDQIKVIGAVNLNGATLSTSLYGGFAPSAAGSAPIVIIDNDGADAVIGTFAGLAEGSVFTLGGQQVKISYVGGTGNDVTLQFVGPFVPPVTTAPAPSLTASQAAGYAVQTTNLLRASASDARLADPTSPLSAQAQAEAQIAAKLDAGQISAQDAQSALFHLVDGTTSVAETTYAFFTGRTPTAAGLTYLVNSSANATDLNDAYYAKFSVENRYINFAVNLATGAGAGAATFEAAYGALSLTDATAKAYLAVFGTTASADKVAAILGEQVSNGLGGTETRAQYFADITGGSAAAQKAAAIGFLLADSVKEGFGAYQQADLHFLQDLAHGTAAFNVDLLAAYGQAPNLVGQPVLDPTLGG